MSGEIAGPKLQRRLAAIFAADVEGYSRLMAVDEVGTLRTLTAHREIMDRLIGERGGRIANTAGDSVLAEFLSVVEAVQAAVEVQEALRAANETFPEDRQIRFRIGVHVGDVIVKDGDLFGDGVNIAARLQAVAEPGAVCISATAHEHVRKSLQLPFEDLGPQTVKNIPEPVKAFAVRSSGGAAPTGTAPPQVESLKVFPLPDKPSIAVLPFANMSDDPEQEYFAGGVTEDIITELSRFKELSVRARSASFGFRGNPVTLEQIHRGLDVKYLLEGSVRKLGKRLRLNVRLVDAVAGAQVWAERYDQDIEQIFDVQDEIVGTIVTTLSGRIKADTSERAKRKPPSSWQAYDCFLMGMEGYQAPRTPENLHQAIKFFQRAIELDPRYSRAYGKLAASSTLLARARGGDNDAHRREIASAIEWAQKGVSLDEADADSLLALGYALLYQQRFEEGEHYIERAFVLNPHDESLALGHVTALSYLGKPEQAIEKVEAVLGRAPNHRIALFDLAVARFFARQHEAAATLFSRLPVNEERRVVVATYAHAGWIDQAENQAELYLEELQKTWFGAPMAEVGDLVNWNLTFNCIYRRPQDIAHVREGLRLAGLPI